MVLGRSWLISSPGLSDTVRRSLLFDLLGRVGSPKQAFLIMSLEFPTAGLDAWLVDSLVKWAA